MTIVRLLAVLLVFLPGAAQAQSVGRLFFTPDQRTMLENLKGRPPVAVTQISETITVNGLIQRGDGSNVVWINGVPQAPEQADVARRGVTPTAVPVVLPGSGRTVQMKVGQSVEVSSGALKEGAPAARPETPPAKQEKAAESAREQAPAGAPAGPRAPAKGPPQVPES